MVYKQTGENSSIFDKNIVSKMRGNELLNTHHYFIIAFCQKNELKNNHVKICGILLSIFNNFFI